jgi:hypothetical protein
MLLMARSFKSTQTTDFMVISSDFLREHHRSLTVVILPSSGKRIGSPTDGQFSPVGKLKNACEREGELSRVRKDYARLSTAAFNKILIFVYVADCAALSRGWLQQVRQSLKTRMTLFGWHVLGAKLRGYRALISILIRRRCSFTNILNSSRIQAIDGVSGASRSMTWASIPASGDEIDASRFRSGNTMRDCGLDGFLLFKHLSKVIGLLPRSHLVTCTWICCVTSFTSTSHGPAQ